MTTDETIRILRASVEALGQIRGEYEHDAQVHESLTNAMYKSQDALDYLVEALDIEQPSRDTK